LKLHGYTAKGVVYLTYFDLEARVDPKQYILMAPEDTENMDGVSFWNASPAACCAYYDEDKLVDDRRTALAPPLDGVRSAPPMNVSPFY
jgi:hypothetical protein